MENNKAFMLTNRGKASFFYCHHHLLPPNHRYRKNKNDFFVGRVEKDVAPPRLSGEELFDVVSEYGHIVFDSCIHILYRIGDSNNFSHL